MWLLFWFVQCRDRGRVGVGGGAGMGWELVVGFKGGDARKVTNLMKSPLGSVRRPKPTGQ